MAIRVACPSCESSYNLADNLAGKKVRCKSCGHVFTVPETVAPAPKQPPPAPPRRDAVQSDPPPVPLTRDDEEFADVRERVRANVGRRGPSPLLIGSLVGAVAIFLVGGLIAWMLLAGGEPQKAAQPPQQQAKADDGKQPDGKQPDGKQPDEKQPDDKKPDEKKPAPKEEFNLSEARKGVVYVKRLAPGLPAASSTGFFVSKDGLVYTNRHVIETIPQRDDTRILVGVPSAKDPDVLDYFKAEVVFRTGPGDALDFAILKVAARPEYGPFRPLPLSLDKLQLGAAVAAVGYPGGLKEEVPTIAFNKGAISAPAEKFDNRTHYRTDAQVNPGNSGGPLLNTRGEVVGIITFRKNNAKGMNYALHLSETVQAAKVDPGKVAALKAEPGPLDEKQVAQLVPRGIEPKAAAWEVTQGKTREFRGYMTVDANGAPYWLTTREELPDNFQITVRVGVEFLQGGQRLQPTQRSILRTLCVRFATADTGLGILERNNGYQIQFSHQYLLLFKDGDVIAKGREGNPDEPFLLTVARKDGEILMTVNGEVVLKHTDRNPISGRAKLSIGGYLSKLYLGELFVTPLPGGKGLPVAKNDPKKGKDKDPVVKDKEPPKPAQPGELVLVAPPTDTAVANGGLAVLLHMPKANRLVLYDAAQNKLVKEVAIEEEDVRIAATRDKFFVWAGRTRTLSRWDLKAMKREATVLLPFEGKVLSMAAGSDSDGPLMMVGHGKFPLTGGALIDTRTLKPVPLSGKQDLTGAERVRASADGRVFTFWPGSGSPGRGCAVFDGNDLTVYREGNPGGGDGSYLWPSADGRMIYGHMRSNGGGVSRRGFILTQQLKPLDDGMRYNHERSLMPSASGPYYANLQSQGGRFSKLDFYVQGDDRLFGSLPGVDLNGQTWHDGLLTADRRIFLLPAAARVVIVPGGGGRLLSYPFDFYKVLQDSELDYLAIASSPPANAARGGKYEYAIKAFARAARLTYKLESGPEGMKVAPEGLLTWDVPADHALPSAAVLVSVADESGREVFHPFTITLTGKIAPVGGGKAPAAPEKQRGEKAALERHPRPAPAGAALAWPDVAPLSAVLPAGEAKKAAGPPTEPTEIPLAGAVAETAVGGGGRWVVLHMPQVGRLALFDGAAGKIVKEVPLSEWDVRLAAGRDKFLVWMARSGVLSRWDFKEFRREASVVLPLEGRVTALAMGSDSDGPAMLVGAGRFAHGGGALIDLHTLKPLSPPSKLELPAAAEVRASANGKLFAFWGGEGRGSVAVDGTAVTVHRDGNTGPGSYVLPSADGQAVYGHLRVDEGGRTNRGGVILTREMKFKEGGAFGETRVYYPTATGPYFANFTHEKNPARLEFYLQGEGRSFAFLETDRLTWRDSEDGLLAFDRRFFMLPAVAKVGTIAKGNNRLIVYPFDVNEALAKSSLDYLVVTSAPVTRVPKGGKYEYAMKTLARGKKLTYQLAAGPDGMKVSPEGVVTWDVPGDFAMADAGVVISVGNENNREIFHSFKIGFAAEVAVKGKDKDPVVGKEKDKDKVRPNEIALPGAAGDLVVGGGGRWVLLHVPKAGKLLLFDAAAQKIVQEAPLEEEDVRLAAGQDKFLVWAARTRTLSRWDFKTFRREASTDLPPEAQVMGLAMGSASQGPALLVGRGKLPLGGGALFDVQTLKPLEVEGKPDLSSAERVRASADGRVFVFWPAAGSVRGAARWDGKVLTTYRDPTGGGDRAYLSPAADGRSVYTHLSHQEGRGTNSDGALLTPELKLIETGPAGSSRVLLAAAAGPYYVNFRHDGRTGRLEFFLHGEPRPFAALDEVAFSWEHQHDGLGFDRRMLVLPAGCVAGIAREKDRLLVYPFDVSEALAKSALDYLVVTSSPPARAGKGQSVAYQVQTLARSKALTYKLESGPPGMTISPAGRVNWGVPADFAGSEAEVRLVITNERKREVLHGFKIAISGDGKGKDKDPVVGKDKPRPSEPFTVQLGEPVGDAVVGGASRYVLLHLPKSKRLLLFDPLKGQVVNETKLAEAGALIAAGDEKFVIWLPEARTLTRWNLRKWGAEATVTLPYDGKVEAMVMGSGSNGPLLMVGSGPFPLNGGALIDLSSLNAIPVGGKPNLSGADRVRASTDGRTFTFWPSKGGTERGTALFAGKNLLTHRGPTAGGDGGYLVPEAHSHLLYARLDAAGAKQPRGVRLTTTLKLIDGGADAKEDRALLPFAAAPYLVSLGLNEKGGRMDVYIRGEEKPFASLADVELTPKIWAGGVLAGDRRVLALPAGECILVIPEGDDRLKVYPFSLIERLRDSKQDYLTFLSSPPTQAAKGSAYRYRTGVSALSKKLTYKVESGPPGMTVSPDGAVSWNVPADFAPAEAAVVISVTNENGRRVEQRFAIAIGPR